MPPEFSRLLVGLAAVWLVAALVHPRVRAALANGLRCAGRYPDVWRIPALFGAAYAFFQVTALVVLLLRLETNLVEWVNTVDAAPMPTPGEIAVAAWVPAIEGTAKTFNAFTTTFPLSAVLALAFLVNASGTLGELTRAVRRRFPRSGFVLVFGLLVCALAAIAKPFVYLLLPEIAAQFPTDRTLLAASVVNLASFVFELLLGVFFLTYLMLMAYAWTRGMHFHRHRLVSFALRRTGFVLKWSFVLVAAATILIVVPGAVAAWVPEANPVGPYLAGIPENIGLPALAFFMLFYCAVQTTLVFHNESLHEAMRDSLTFVRTHAVPVTLFIVASAVPHFLLAGAERYAHLRYGAESSLGAASTGAQAILGALLAGWLIASWVCLYKSLTTGRRDIVF